jgi:hypothetical protein
MRRFVCCFAFGCLTALGLTASANANVIFSDGTFAPADYTQGFLTTGGTGYSGTYSQCSSCGDPGFGLTSTFTTASNGGTAGALADFIGIMNTTFVYNPASGAVTSVDVSIDKDLQANLANTYGNTFRFLIEQDGNFYQYAIPGPALDGSGATGYNPFVGTDLTASDFGLLNLTTGVANASINPNFDGDPLTFGIGQYFSETGINGDNPTVVYHYDNFDVTVQVPEPLTVSLFGAGLVGVFAARRRKAKA